MFNVKINKSTPTVTNRESLASGASKVYHVSFDFDEEWDGLIKSAVFKVGDHSIGVLLETDTCVIPWEVLKEEYIGETLWVGVYGTKEDGTILPTVWDMLEVIQQGAKPLEADLEKTDSIIDTIFKTANAANISAQNAERLALDASDKAGKAEDHAKAANASATEAKTSENNAEIYALAAARSASSAKNSYANAIKETLSGPYVAAADVSPIEHDLTVKLTASEGSPMSGASIIRCGKNLFNFNAGIIKNAYPDMANASLVGTTENGVIVKGKVDGSVPGTYSYFNGWFTPHMNGETENGVFLRNGDKVVISADYTWLDISDLDSESTEGKRGFAIHLNKQDNSNNNSGVYIGKIPTEDDIGVTYRVSVTHTNIRGDGYFIPIFTLNSCEIKIENIQISYFTDTEYEEYNGQSAVSDADGNVTGLVSASPYITIIPEVSGALVECTYNRDLMKVIEELTNAIISLGGNI